MIEVATWRLDEMKQLAFARAELLASDANDVDNLTSTVQMGRMIRRTIAFVGNLGVAVRMWESHLFLCMFDFSVSYILSHRYFPTIPTSFPHLLQIVDPHSKS